MSIKIRKVVYATLLQSKACLNRSASPAYLRNAFMYRILRNILFLFPPEWVHYFSMNCLRIVCSIPLMPSLIKKLFGTHDQRLTTHVAHLQFKNPVGLGAGFDKNAKYLLELEALGFGFVEIGTVTPL